jgi:AcrR family transcriptional regulator
MLRNQSKPESLRDRLRLLQRDAVLDVASEMFLSRGYRRTTISSLAKSAKVGVATVFRYFGSKEGVLAALSRRDIDKTLAAARVVAEVPRSDPASTMGAVFDEILKMHQMPSTQIRGQTRIWLLIRTGHPATDEVVSSSDLELQEIIVGLLRHFRRNGQINSNLDVHDLTVLIFAVFYHHYLAIALDRTIKIDDVAAKMRRRIALLFAGWTAEGNIRQKARRPKGRVPAE